MYFPDETQAALMQAGADLQKSRTAIDAGRWAAQVLNMLLTSAEVGAMETSLAFLKANASRIATIPSLCSEGTEATHQAAAALGMARSKIPNTSPPHPGGLEQMPSGGHEESFQETFPESCLAPAEPVNEWIFIPPT